MGFWNKFGKIALQAAPYVAAPFTGGASLYAIPATKQIGTKWAQHDAEKNAEKGLAPSKFDKYLGMASNIAGMASSAGTPGISGGKYGPSTSFGPNSGQGDWQEKLGGFLGGAQGGGQYGMGSGGGGMGGGIGGSIMDMMDQYKYQGQSPRPGTQQTGGIGPSEQAVSRNLNRTPNLEDYISQGHEEALYDQPWRKPYPSSIYGGIGGNRRFQGSYEPGISPGTY